MKLNILKTITMIMITSTIMVGCSKTKESHEVIATINKNEITLDYYKKTLNLQKLAMEKNYGEEIWESRENYKENFKEEVLDQIIKIYALCDEAKKNNLTASDNEINEKFEEVKSAINSDKDYKKELENLGINDEYIKKQQEQDIMLQKYEEFYLSTVKVSDEEVKDYYDNNKDIQESEFEQVRDYIKMEIRNNKLTENINEIVEKSKINKDEDLVEKIKL